MVRVVTVLLPVREWQRPNSGPEVVHFDRGIPCCCQSLQGNAEIMSQIRQQPLPSTRYLTLYSCGGGLEYLHRSPASRNVTSTSGEPLLYPSILATSRVSARGSNYLDEGVSPSTQR
jgi:hypothetical protein